MKQPDRIRRNRSVAVKYIVTRMSITPVIIESDARKRLMLFVWVIILTACSKSGAPDDSELAKRDGSIVGIWKMSEVRADPGDGSGRFIPTELDVIMFL